MSGIAKTKDDRRSFDPIAFRRGAEHAASLADEYNGASTHDYRLGDCVLAKMNLISGKPRKNKKRVKPRDLAVQWFALALAEVNRRADQPTTIIEVARAAGMTLREMRAAGVDEFDLRELRRAGVK